ncbi:MAG: hypothetical protein V1846_03980 [Candidatus Komeilibacteria bacterium]
MEPKIDGLPENYERDRLSDVVSRLTKLRDGYSNVIPNTDVSAGPSKVRHAWFQSLLLDIGEVLKLHENQTITIPPDLLETINGFTQHITSDDFKARPTTQEDIGSANAVLDKIIDQLKI